MKRLFALLITIALAACARHPAEPPQSESADSAAESPATTTSSATSPAIPNTVDAVIRGETRTFDVTGAASYEQLELARRAVELVAELDEVEGTGVYTDDFLTNAWRKWDCEIGENIEICEIDQFGELPIKIYTHWLPSEREAEVYVKFAFENDEWIIDRAYGFLESDIDHVEVIFRGEKLSLPVRGSTTYGETELVQKTIDILVALDEDYDIRIIMTHLQTNIYENSVEIPIGYSNTDCVSYVTVTFVDIDGEPKFYYLQHTEG